MPERPRGPDGAFLPASPPPDAEPPAWAKSLLDKVERLETELRETKARTPAFKPMAAPQGRRGPQGIFAGMNPAPGRPVEREGVSKQILVDERGEKLPQFMKEQYPPRFEPGDYCRINPDATRPGWPETKTWGSVLSALGVEGVGVVRKVYWLRDDGQWKYSAVVKGITNQRPDGFLDSELLPA